MNEMSDKDLVKKYRKKKPRFDMLKERADELKSRQRIEYTRLATLITDLETEMGKRNIEPPDIED